MAEIIIKGAGGTIGYPTEVIIKALREAGITVEVEDDHPCEDVERLLTETKKRLDSGYIKEWKVVVKTKHLPWGG
jgi:hypothetical protein